MPVPATLSSPGKPGDFASDGTDLYIYTGTGRPPHSWIVAGSGGGSGTVTSVNGQTGAVNVKPLTTFAALTSDAITLGHDGITRTDTISATKNLTLASAGSSGDERILDFTVTGGTQTVTTNFAVIRNLAGSASTVSRVFKDRAWIKMVNVNGTIHWFDNGFDAVDLPVGNTPVSFTPAADNVKAYFDAIDTSIAALSATITGIDSAPVGTGGLWTTSDLANRPLNWLVCDGTNGTPSGGTVGGMTAIIKGGGTVATPTVDIAGGTYTGTQNVTLTSATSGASIYVTQNGVDPTTSDTLVSGTVAVTTSGTLKAKAFKSLMSASGVLTQTYTINPAFTYIYENELVYANAGAATSDGWTTASGAPTYVYSTSTISGFASNIKATWGDRTSRSFTPTGDVSICIKLKAVSVSATSQAFAITDGSTNLAKVIFQTGGVVKFGYGATNTGSVDSTYSTATDYWLWIDRVKSTGVVKFYLSTTGTKPSVTATCNTGYTTLDASAINLMASASSTFIFNDLFVDDAPIGSNP